MSAPERLSPLSRALTRLTLDQPFFGTLLAMTPLIPQRDLPTLATDGARIFYNPDFLAGLTPDEAVGALTHELLHICYGHCDPVRRDGRAPARWNAACDFAINQELFELGFHLPSGSLRDPAYRGLVAERIFERLPPSTFNCLDQLLPLPASARTEVEGRISTASAACAGRLPAGLSRRLAGAGRARVPWQRVLRRFLWSALARGEESFLPPNRRHLWDGRYLPSLAPATRPRLAVAVDTSASISPALLDDFAAEVASLRSLTPDITLITCDAAVQDVVEPAALPARLRALEFKGGGGTDFSPVFDLIASWPRPPEALVYLTDGRAKGRPKRRTDPLTLWMIFADGPVPPLIRS